MATPARNRTTPSVSFSSAPIDVSESLLDQMFAEAVMADRRGDHEMATEYLLAVMQHATVEIRIDH